jgi:uncharacterized membrane protein
LTTRTQRYWLAGLIVIFVVAVLYVHAIHFTYMTADENLVYRFTRESLTETVSYLANRDVHPPLWFSFFWGWRRVVGESDFAGRIHALFLSLMTLAVVYQLGKRWFGAPRYGLFAMVVLAVSGLFLRYTLEIRPYALAMFLASLSMVAFWRWLKLRTWRTALVYGASIAALLYVHYFLFLFLLAQGVYFLIFARPSRRMWQQSFGVAAAAFLLWLPWFPSFLSQFGRIRSVEVAAGEARGLAGSGATTQATSLEEIIRLAESATNGLFWLYVLVLVIGFIYWWRKDGYRLALIWAVGVPAITFLVNLVAAVYTPRYIINFVIGLALVLAAGLGRLSGRVRWLALAGFTAVNLWVLPTQMPNDVVPYSLLYRQLAEAWQPGDVVLFDQGGWGDGLMQWQWRHHSTPEMRLLATDKTEQALTARRVWHVAGDWLNEDVQANFRQIEGTHPRQTGFGGCDIHWCYVIQLMEAPPWSEPQVFGEDMAFWGADIDGITPQAIQARLWWRVEQTPTKDYSIGLHLLDVNGNLIAQSDSSIHHYGSEQVTNTSQLEPDKIYIDFRTLNLSGGLFPGDYQLAVVVYDWQTGERLRLADGTDHLTLETIKVS